MNKKGFTLIEILSVLVIVSILVVISIPSISDMLEKSKEKSKQEVIQMVKSAAEMYALDYKIGLAEPIYMTELCKNYLKCPIKDPITDAEITGYLYSRIDKANSNARVYELKTGTPTTLNTTILATVGGKDISINKYAGNGLYKWGDKYIYRGGLTKTNPSGTLNNSEYINDVDSGSEVSNYIKVPWEIYTTGEVCTSTTNKCYRIMEINEDGTIKIIRDKAAFNQVFDNTFNSEFNALCSVTTTAYGYNTLLANNPPKAKPNEYRQFSLMYNVLYGSAGYENTNLKSYISILEPLDVCLNKTSKFNGINANTPVASYVNDTCDVSSKPNTTFIYPLKSKYVRLPYMEEYLNASTEPACTENNRYECRNQNYTYNKTVFWLQNGDTTYSCLVNAVPAHGSGSTSYAGSSNAVRPVVTLKKDLIIIGGNGTAASPYEIAN